ncbi:MAG TPA: GntR family transcriptional regulator [Planctomycetota bacterium]
MKKSGAAKPRSRPRKGNLAAETAEQLRAAILGGEFHPGQSLRELDLCRRLKVSRVPLREALQKLAGERLVVIRPNRGAEVARVSEVELLEIAEACRLLEGHLLALAAPSLAVRELDECGELLERLDEEDDTRAWTRLNWEFHLKLYGPAGRPFLLEWVGGLRARAELATLILVADKHRRLELNREHRGIVEALRRSRGAEAVRLLEAHLSGAKDTVLRVLHAGPEPGSGSPAAGGGSPDPAG